MSRSLVVAAALASAVAAASPALVQSALVQSAQAQTTPRPTASQGPDGAADTHLATGQFGAGQVADLQRDLSRRGFSPGRVDGLWGPETEAALRRFQTANRLQTTGDADQATLQALGMAGATVLAQNTAGTTAAPAVTAPAVTAPAVTAPAATAPGSMTGPASRVVPPVTAPGSTAGSTASGVNAASGNNNQAVATTNANAPQPAHGANSFTIGEARRRIAGQGFQNVSGLRKDNGVWRGTATKDGQQVSVWLDYKGNIGQQ